jgi:glutamine synthetase
MPETPQEVLKMIQDNNIKIIDLKFIDMPGIWQHCSFYYDQIDESSFSDGVAFDGSSICGWKAINESDMASGSRSHHCLDQSLLQGTYPKHDL